MVISIPEIAERIHSLLAGQGVGVHMFSPTGDSVSDPRDASRFIVHKPNLVIRLNKDDESISLMAVKDIYDSTLHQQLRNLARDYLMSFDYRLFDKTLKARGEKLDAKRAAEQEMTKKIEETKLSYDEFVGVGDHVWDCTYELKGRHAHLKRHGRVQTKERDMEAAKVSIKKKHPNADMASIKCIYAGVRHSDGSIIETKGFSRPRGTTRTSYQKLDDSISIMVRHKKRISEEDEVRPGVRSRNIDSVFIKRGAERFKMAENHLPSARAMARHMQNGGEFWDKIGESINSAAGDMKKLSKFVQYVDRRGLINEDNSEYVELAREQLGSLRSVIEGMGSQRGYARNSHRIVELMSAAPEDLDEDLEGAFVEKRKDDRVTTAMEELKGLVSKRRAFQRTIDEAVEDEKFEGISDLLREGDMVDFQDSKARIGYQVGQLGSAAKNESLSSYLNDISSKISAGGQLSQHEHGTVKRCLVQATGQQVNESNH